MMKFTLLMCLYEKESPLFLLECFESIANLTVKPAEIVIVKDGPLPNELEAVLDKTKESCDIPRTIVALPENVTLGPARAEGVTAAKYEWVAVMDTDDICRSDRFEKQLEMIKANPELGLIGGQISEFEGNISSESTTHNRTVPIDHEDIINFAKFRSPFNHMTVMFKRDEVLRAGNYRLFTWFEDYDLWTRMIKNGTICANHRDVLVDARMGADSYSRRRGKAYIRSEWRMQKQLKSLGIITGTEFLRNTAIRIPVRLLPGKVLQRIYRGVLR